VSGRLCLLAFVAASGAVHYLPAMPDRGTWAAILAGGVFVTITGFVLPATAGYRWRLALPIWAGIAGLLVTTARVEVRLADALDSANENRVARVVLRIAGLPRISPDSRHFEADVLSSSPAGVPSRIQVTWTAPNWSGPYGRGTVPAAEFPDLVPGQVWRMALTLKKPHGARNPHAFDYESYLFAQGIRATGSVRGTPKYLHDEPWANLPIIAQRARHRVRAAMLPYLQDMRYGAVMLALAIGDQASVEAEDWLVFNRTGITHLVSISGSHITMIAALAGALVLYLWRRLQFRGRAWAERLPAQVASALAALLVAWLYCLLAGWGVPARRTFLMLAVVACAYVVRMPISAYALLSLVAFVVVLLDPWALLASGFWLSFGAVCVLMASSGWWGRRVHRSVESRWRRIAFALGAAMRLQLAITAGLLPVLATIFHEASVASPFANAYAIPVISLIVTPLSLLLAGVALVPGADMLAAALAWAAHGALDLIMVPTVWLSGLTLASFNVAAAPWALTALAMAGLILAVMPYGWPARHGGWLLMLPALFWQPRVPPDGAWDLHALDVGQAGAIVVRTAHHAVVFDTGLRRGPASDDGARVIWPFLRSQGIKKIDVLVVSHADIDHAGGARSLLASLPVEQSYSSFDLQDYLERESRLLGEPDHGPRPGAMSPCEYGQTWDIDGVSFAFLWPFKPAGAPRSQDRKQRNDQACVLRIRGRFHTALLPADIGAGPEDQLVARELGAVDVVVAAHHGSRYSSTPQFVGMVQAGHVIAQAGLWNRYGHPSEVIEKRWQDSGAVFWRTDLHGAIQIRSRPDGLSAEAARRSSPRYWQSR
jgi:competence protein ComEC